jgi:topoisomerase (DNA) II binding protein 1
LEESAEKKEPQPVLYYHQPYVKQPGKPLDGIVIAISNYGGRERSYLSNLVVELGALYQDVFAKKAATNRGAVASTHLVCPLPEGSKFEAAVKWSKPAVTKDWLLKCAETSSLAAEDPYLLNKNLRRSVAPSPSASVLSNSIASSSFKDDTVIIFSNLFIYIEAQEFKKNYLA